jgi:hypothetical protein
MSPKDNPLLKQKTYMHNHVFLHLSEWQVSEFRARWDEINNYLNKFPPFPPNQHFLDEKPKTSFIPLFWSIGSLTCNMTSLTSLDVPHHRSTIFNPHKILFEIHRVFCFFCFSILIFTDFIQSPIIIFWWRDLRNPRPATDFPRPAPYIFCGASKWKNVFHTSRIRFAFFNAPKVNCSPFQFVIFSYPMGMDHIVLCNP